MKKNKNTFTNLNFEIEVKDFLKKFRNKKDSINPYWQKIDSSISNINLDNTLDEIVEHLNQKKLTTYINQPFPLNLYEMFKNRNFIEEEEPLANGTLHFFKNYNFKILDEYLDTLKEFNWKPNLVNGRHFYYSCLIRKVISKKKIRVLEIGGGTGMLVSFLRKHFDIDYVNVDFAEMIVLNAYENKNRSNIEFIHDITEYSNLFRSNTSRHIIPKIFLDNIENFKKFDLYLNTHSFMEMDKEIRDKYILASSKILSRNGFFFNSNWVQSQMTNIDGTLYNNDPLMYPYPKNLNNILFEEDQFHKYLRLNFNYKTKRSLGFINLCQKNKNLLNLPGGIQLLY